MTWAELWAILKNPSKLKPPVYFTDEYIDALMARNEKRRQEAIKQLGPKWLLHPDNKRGRQ